MSCKSARPSRAYFRFVTVSFLTASLLISGCSEGSGDRDSESADSVPTDAAESSEATAEDAEALDRLQNLGYLGGYSAPTGDTFGVTFYAEENSYAGYNLYNSGHDTGAVLMDMEGNDIHSWNIEFETVWPDHREVFKDLKFKRQDHKNFWRRVELDAAGNAYAIFELYGMVKLDHDSNLIWSYPGGTHHDLELMDDGTIWTLDMSFREMDILKPGMEYMDNYVAHLDSNGELIKRVSVYESIKNSDYAYLFDKTRERYLDSADVFHCNALDVLDGAHEGLDPAFKKGNILISVLRQSAQVIIDPEEEKAVWVYDKRVAYWHQPVMLETGNILYFDNMGGTRDAGLSRVVEFNPVTEEEVWVYGGTPENPFESRSSGSCQRLPNGNTLIVESNKGRAIELNAEKQIVWEFYNPNLLEVPKKHTLVATLFDLARYEIEFVDSWLRK